MNNPEAESPSHPEKKEQDPFDALIGLLKHQDDPLAYEILFQGRLAVESVGRGNLLTALNEAGILPHTDFGNPYDIAKQPAAYQKWFEAHPDKAAQFQNAMHEYNTALRYLYLGTILGDRFGKNMYPKHQYIMPKSRKNAP